MLRIELLFEELDLRVGSRKPIRRVRSGIADEQESYLAFGEERITSSELRSLIGPKPPAILILNSHYTAFMPRGLRPNPRGDRTPESDVPPPTHLGFLEVATTTGVGALVGCFASPGDEPAKTFGARLHTELLAGVPIGLATYRARQAASQANDVTAWQYVLSGHPGYRLQKG